MEENGAEILKEEKRGVKTKRSRKRKEIEHLFKLYLIEDKIVLIGRVVK